LIDSPSIGPEEFRRIRAPVSFANDLQQLDTGTVS
jgi:hypothetical protein